MWQQKTAIFLVSQFLSLLGTSFVQYALMWFVTLDTKSGLMMTAYVVCGFLPTFILSPFGGVWADRYNRKVLIMLSDGFTAVVTLALALVFMFHGKSLLLVMIAAALRSVGTALQGPAVGAILPQFVPKEYLTRVNGIFNSLQAAITLVSPIISGVLITVWPLYLVFFIDLVTAVVAIITLFFFLNIPVHAKAAEKQKTGYFSDLLLGFHYIKGHRYLLSFFTFVGIFLFLITPAAFLTPLQVARSFGGDVWRLTAIEVVISGGMILGGGIIGVWGGLKNRMHTLVLSAFVMGLCTVGLGVAGIFWLYLCIMGIFGIALSFFNTPAAVFLQEHVEESFMGRVFSFNTMLFTSIMPLGMLLFGPLAEAVRIERILIITGFLILVQGLVMFREKRLIEAGVARAPYSSTFAISAAEQPEPPA
jgi:DHA3 family macrolide efflux protein-like MFS transporter